MLFTCPSNAARGGKARTSAAGQRPFCIDIHCHVHVPAADDMVRPLLTPDREPSARFSNELSRATNRKQMENVWTCLTSVEQRLRDMDKMGVNVQAISPSPFHFMYWLEPDLARKASRAVNEHLASIVAAHPDRFVALGHVPLQAPDLAADELRYCVRQLGFRGAEIGTNRYMPGHAAIARSVPSALVASGLMPQRWKPTSTFTSTSSRRPAAAMTEDHCCATSGLSTTVEIRLRS